MCIETEAEVQQGQTYRKLIKQVKLPGDQAGQSFHVMAKNHSGDFLRLQEGAQ